MGDLKRIDVFEAVLFDCDGVLVDSEPITLGVLTQCLNAEGWALGVDECAHHFLGRAVKDQAPLFEQMTGKPLTEHWLAQFRAERDKALSAELLPIPGIHKVVEYTHQRFNAKIACASGADRGKVELQLSKVDLMGWFGGRIFSGHEMPKTKPAPDVYLAAAKGVQAGVSAGATVWAYLAHTNTHRVQARQLRDAGAHKIFEHMDEIHQYLKRS